MLNAWPSIDRNHTCDNENHYTQQQKKGVVHRQHTMSKLNTHWPLSTKPPNNSIYIYIWHMVGSAGALNHSSSCSQPVSLQNNQTMLSSWSQLCRPTWYVQNTINVASRKTWWAHRPVIHTEWSMDAKWFVRSRPPHAIKVFINYNSAHGSPNTKTCTSFICHI